MSYCRWSCDDFGSDVYCYADVSGGYTVHLAGMKVVGEVPKIAYDKWNKENIDAFMESYRAQSDFMETAERVPIGLPFDGKTFWDETAKECAQRLRGLRELGYRVPEGVIESLEEESEDDD